MIAIIAMVVTMILGLIGAAMWGKISKVINAINLITKALEDKTISTEEAEAIWAALK